jgi:hypothetical protein
MLMFSFCFDEVPVQSEPQGQKAEGGCSVGGGTEECLMGTSAGDGGDAGCPERECTKCY